MNALWIYNAVRFIIWRGMRGEYFFWGSNGNSECLVYLEEQKYVCYQGQDVNLDFVSFPTKFVPDMSMEIMAVYLGYNCTNIVARNVLANAMNDKVEKRSPIKQKLDKLKSWFGGRNSSIGMNRSRSSSMERSEINDEKKYDDEESFDEEIVKWLYRISYDRMSRKSETY